jgi:tryptophan synthase alpha chain
MSRITATFERCEAENRAALVAYLTGYDPDLEGSFERMSAACHAGVDVLEVGVPFSDPSADGADVQAAMVRALRAGSSMGGVLEIIRRLREVHQTPIVLFSYCNPLLSQEDGVAATMGRIKEAGVDALLVVDIPPEAAPILRDPAQEAGLDWIGLVAPTSHARRRAKVCASASGFVYAVSLTGVTGASLDTDDPGLRSYLSGLKQATTLPVCVGFGVRTAAQASALASIVDGVVVGSALVRAGMGGVDPLRALVETLADAVRRPPR